MARKGGWVGRQRTSIITVFRVPETGRYGYSYHFEEESPHHVIDACATLQDAINACDPSRGNNLGRTHAEDDGRTVMVVQWQEGHRFQRNPNRVRPRPLGTRSVIGTAQK